MSKFEELEFLGEGSLIWGSLGCLQKATRITLHSSPERGDLWSLQILKILSRIEREDC